jgi:hypothetical protein
MNHVNEHLKAMGHDPEGNETVIALIFWGVLFGLVLAVISVIVLVLSPILGQWMSWSPEIGPGEWHINIRNRVRSLWRKN